MPTFDFKVQSSKKNLLKTKNKQPNHRHNFGGTGAPSSGGFPCTVLDQ